MVRRPRAVGCDLLGGHPGYRDQRSHGDGTGAKFAKGGPGVLTGSRAHLNAHPTHAPPLRLGDEKMFGKLGYGTLSAYYNEDAAAERGQSVECGLGDHRHHKLVPQWQDSEYERQQILLILTAGLDGPFLLLQYSGDLLP